MSPSGSRCLLEALNVLRKASGESLRPHRTELLAAVQKIDQSATPSVASRHDLPSTRPGNSGRVPLSSASHLFLPGHQETHKSISIPAREKASSNRSRDQHAHPQPPSQDQTLSPVSLSPIEVFVKELEKDLEKIEKLLSEVCRNAGQNEPSWTTDDPRIVDIRLAGERTSAQGALRRGLSQRSLAIEFSDWEERAYGTSKVKERTNQSTTEPGPKSGHLKEYLHINEHRFHNMEVARGGIQHGIKLLVCEQLLGGMGYSAIFVFRYGRLLKVKNGELNELKDVITSSEPLTKLAAQKADWFYDCQSDYNADLHRVAQQTPNVAVWIARLINTDLFDHVNCRRADSNHYMDNVSPSPAVGFEVLASSGRSELTSPIEKTPFPRHEQSQQPAAGPQSPLQPFMTTNAPPNPVHTIEFTRQDGSYRSHMRERDPSFTATPQEQVGGTLFNPSGYPQEGNPSFTATPQEQVGGTLFNPSGYPQEGNPSFTATPQEQVGGTLFNPSGYPQEGNLSFNARPNEQVANTSYSSSIYVQ